MQSGSKDSLELSRFTIFLYAFDKKVITQMGKKKKQSHSGVIRYIIHNWIESHPNLLKENYDIDLNNISGEIEIVNHPQVIQNSLQKLEKHPDSKKSSELFRITFSLDAYDNKVITLMSERREQFLSEIVRNLVHSWIEKNSDILKSKYDIDLNEVTKEIDYDHVIQSTIQKLVEYSGRFNEIDEEILAEQLDISKKLLRTIIFEYNNKLAKLGVKLQFRGKLIVKE